MIGLEFYRARGTRIVKIIAANCQGAYASDFAFFSLFNLSSERTCVSFYVLTVEKNRTRICRRVIKFQIIL